MATEKESKITANIESDLYDAVSPHFHYGQRSIFFNKLFTSLKTLAESGKWNEVVDYMYNDSELNLPN
jgi:hypothetical protein